MNRFTTRAVLVGAVCCLAISGLASTAPAVPITFIQQGARSGSLAGAAFSTTAFTITATGDTSQRVEVGPGVYSIDHASARIEVAGLGLFTFVTPTRTFVNQATAIAGFSRSGLSGTDLFDLDRYAGASFHVWDLTTGIGPVSGTGFLTQWENSPVETSGGVLVFNANASVPTVFTAVIPEPAAATLLITALLAGLGRLRRSHTHV